MKTWVAVVNRREARVFEINEKYTNGHGRDHQKLKLVQKLENTLEGVRNVEIETDRRLTQAPKERVAEMFAKDISAALEKGHNEHLFQDLILVVEPHFLGKVRAALSKKTFKTISDTLHKDLAHVADHDIAGFIWPKTEAAFEEVSPTV